MFPSERNLKTLSLILRITHINGVNTGAQVAFTLKHKLITITQLIAFVPQINGLSTVWSNPGEICLSLMFYVFATQLITVGISRVVQNDVKKVPIINGMIGDFYLKHEKDEEFRKILSPFTDLCYSIIKWFIIYMIGIFHIPAIFTWTYTCVTGEFFYIAPLYFPFIDPQTIFGYVINQTYVTYLITTIFITNSPVDIWYLYLTLQNVPMVENLIRKLDKFRKNLISSKTLSQTNIKALETSFSKIHKTLSVPLKMNIPAVKLHQHLINNANNSSKDLERQFIEIIEEFKIYNDFIQRNLRVIKWSSCVTFSVSSIGIGMAIVVIRFWSIPIGLAAVSLFTTQVLIQCVQGTIVIHQNEKFLKTLCGFPWYELSKDQQKIFLQFIHVCQSACVLNIPLVGELNMELFTSVMNGAYSLLTYMLKFTKS